MRACAAALKRVSSAHGSNTGAMPRRKRSIPLATARQLNREQLSRLGAELRASRKRRRETQGEVSRKTGLSASSVSAIERGWGGNFSLDAIQGVAQAVGRTVLVKLNVDALTEPADAGHLAIQELVLGLGRRAGFARTFELSTRPASPAHSADVGLRHDGRRLLILVECWNTIGDIGASARASERKRAEAEQLAVAIGPLDDRGVAGPYRVRVCWVIRATRRNRALVARYPEVFASRFPGSSARWVDALVRGVEPPTDPGSVWADVRCTRLFAWRRPG